MCHSNGQCPYEDKETGYCTLKFGEPYPDNAICIMIEKVSKMAIKVIFGERSKMWH